MISLVVLPHVLHHQLHCVWVRGLTMEVHPHEGGHSRQQAGDLLQLLTGIFHTVGPGVIHQENTAGSTGGRWTEILLKSFLKIQFKVIFLSKLCIDKFIQKT